MSGHQVHIDTWKCSLDCELLVNYKIEEVTEMTVYDFLKDQFIIRLKKGSLSKFNLRKSKFFFEDRVYFCKDYDRVKFYVNDETRGFLEGFKKSGV